MDRIKKETIIEFLNWLQKDRGCSHSTRNARLAAVHSFYTFLPQGELKGREPLFVNREERLKNIKGMIISAINEAIREKNTDSVKKLKKLVDKLANELL